MNLMVMVINLYIVHKLKLQYIFNAIFFSKNKTRFRFRPERRLMTLLALLTAI